MGASAKGILGIVALGAGAYFGVSELAGLSGAATADAVAATTPLAAGVSGPVATGAAGYSAVYDSALEGGVTSALTGKGAALGLEAGSQLIGGAAKYEAGKENAGIASYNAQIAGQNATFAAQAGEQAAGNESLATRAQAGGAMAQEGASGVDVGSGSFQDTQKSIRQTGELNALTIRSNAARQAYGFQSQVVGENAQAKIDTQGADFGLAQGAVGAVGTTLLNSTGNPWQSQQAQWAMG